MARHRERILMRKKTQAIDGAELGAGMTAIGTAIATLAEDFARLDRERVEALRRFAAAMELSKRRVEHAINPTRRLTDG